ncbi:MAG TPA: tetratricopeptide repeat protein [Woeseiaceae bacterium]|nr:tetratricopeptide repeat protein [Woeseiaceae bacterium]
MAERRYQLMRGGIAGLMLGTFMVGCAMQGPQPAPGDPETDTGEVGRTTPAEEPMSAAGTSLLAQGRAQREVGEIAQASSTLERAIRIDPRQAKLWLELARVRMQEGSYAQAEQLARKAGSVGGPNTSMQAEIDDVIGEARRRQGLRLPIN